jgi:hypothetical protein
MEGQSVNNELGTDFKDTGYDSKYYPSILEELGNLPQQPGW